MYTDLYESLVGLLEVIDKDYDDDNCRLWKFLKV